MKVRLICSFLLIGLIGLPVGVARSAEVEDLKINEVCPINVQGIVDSDPGAWFELYNPLEASVSTAGLSITDANLLEIASLPDILIPPAGYLVVQLGEGVNDLDASDGTAFYCLGWTKDLRLSWTGGALALFRGGIDAANLRDFVAWGTAPMDATPAADMAIAADQWSGGRYVDLAGSAFGASFGLASPGLDRDAVSPFAVFTGIYGGGIQTPGKPNVLIAHPLPGEIEMSEDMTEVTAGWVPTSFFGSQTSYEVHLDRAAQNGDRTNVLVQQTEATSGALPLQESGEYIWRVDPCENGISVGLAPERNFYRMRLVGEHRELNVPFVANLKDTRMLCLYNDATLSRPGCTDTHWNVPHTPDMSDEHDAFLSARAAIAMVNHYYGGDMSCDRISYEIFKNKYAGGEGDLGHGVGFRTADITTALRWALGGITTNYAPYAPGFEYVKSEIDLGHPIVLTTTPGANNREGAVIDAYAILQLYQDCPPMPSVRVLDPRAGASYWILYSFYAPTIAAHWQITGNPVGVVQEAAIGADSDGDGIVDFDEMPAYARLGSNAGIADTDGDFVNDILEVYCYTFHDAMHNGHSNDAATFADVENDGHRAENDLDSDNGGRNDGIEDWNRNGVAPEAGETCPYMASDDAGGQPPADVVDGGPRELRLARLASSDAACRFRIDLPRNDRIEVVVFDASGRVCSELACGDKTAGSHELTWDGRDARGHDAPSGVYLARLATDRQGSRAVKFTFLR